MKTLIENNQPNIRQLILVCLCLIMFQGFAFSQEIDKDDALSSFYRFDVSFAHSRQSCPDLVKFSSGYSFQTAYGVYLHRDLAIGAGIGYLSLGEECFLPVFAEVVGYKKHRKKSPYLSMQAGYSPGWNNSPPQNANYIFQGGTFVNIGVGQKFKISDKGEVLFQCSYRHQVARKTYDDLSVGQCSNDLSFDMIILSLSYMIGK